MKKILTAMLAFCFCIVTPLMLCSCDKHNYSQDWSYNETSHYHVCLDDDCDDKIDVADHVFDNGVVEGDTITYSCTICGYQKKESLIHTHTFSDTYSSDENNHWKECTNDYCDEKTEFASHSYDSGERIGDFVKYKCTVCGYEKQEAYVEPHDHVYGEWVHDANSHWKECTFEGCTLKSELSKHTFDEGDLVGDTVTYTCTICREKYSHTHTYSNSWSTDDNAHWKECLSNDCDELLQYGKHTYGEGVVEGEQITFVCTTCEKEYTCEYKEHYYLSSFEKFNVSDYTFKITNLNLTNLETEIGYKIDIAELYLRVDDYNEYFGYGYCDLLDPETNRVLLEGRLVLGNDTIYVSSIGSIDGYYQDVKMKFVVDDLLYLLLSSEFIDNLEYFRLIEENQVLINEVLSTLKIAYFENRESLNNILNTVVDKLFTTTLTEDGTVTYKLNLNFLKEANNYLNTEPVKDIYETIYGIGEYDVLVNRIVGLLHNNLGEVLDILETNGIVVDEILDYIDEIIANYGYIIFDNYLEIDSTIEINTLEQLLVAMGYDISFEDLGELLKTEEFRTMSVVDFLNMTIGSNYSESEWESLIKAGMAMAGQKSIYALVEEAVNEILGNTEDNKLSMQSIKEYIDSFIDLIDSAFSISYTVDSSGKLVSAVADLNLPDVISGKVELLKETVSNVDIKVELEKYKEMFSNYDITFDQASNIETDYTKQIYTDENGNQVISYTYVSGSKASSGFYIEERYEFVFDSNNNFVKMGRYKEISEYDYENSSESPKIFTEYSYNEITSNNFNNTLFLEFNCGNKIVNLDILSKNGESYRYDQWNDTISVTDNEISLMYNTTTQRFVIEYNPETKYHTFEEIESDREYTDYGCLMHFKCKDCEVDLYYQYNFVANSRLQYSFDNYVNGLENAYIYDENAGFVYAFDSMTNSWVVDASLDVSTMQYVNEHTIVSYSFVYISRKYIIYTVA